MHTASHNSASASPAASHPSWTSLCLRAPKLALVSSVSLLGLPCSAASRDDVLACCMPLVCFRKSTICSTTKEKRAPLWMEKWPASAWGHANRPGEKSEAGRQEGRRLVRCKWLGQKQARV